MSSDEPPTHIQTKITWAQVEFSALAALLSALIFYCIYLPYYLTVHPGFSFQHFAYVLVFSTLTMFLASIITAFLIWCFTNGNSLFALFKTRGIGNSRAIVALLFVQIVNAIIFVLGMNEVLITGVTNAGLSHQLIGWLLLWALLKIGLQVESLQISHFLQTRVLWYSVLLLTFVVLFVLSIVSLMGNSPLGI